MRGTNHVYDWLVQAVAEDESGNITVQSYSGRGMYGRRCLGFVTRQFTSPLVIAAVFTDYIRKNLQNGGSQVDACDMLDMVSDLFTNDVREDNMGLGGVVYFPNVAWQSHFEDILDGMNPEEKETDESEDEEPDSGIE